MDESIGDIRASVVALSALVRALVETHPDPTQVRSRFEDLAQRQIDALRASSDDAQRDAADTAAASVRQWSAILAQTPTQQRG